MKKPSQINEKMEEVDTTKLLCGVIMPISAIDGCSSEHWKEVLSILKESIELADFEANLVSDAEDIGIIQKRIVQNIYNNPIVVCDVSGKNPNVMFELGLRLAFDKPTIIVKDDKTDYSFDTSPIEHLTYPRDLRFYKVIQFKEKLTEKIKATYKASKDDPNYTTFLKHFGEYKVSNIQEKEISSDKYILQAIEELRYEIRNVSKVSRRNEIDDSARINIAKEVIDNRIANYLNENRLSEIDLIIDDKQMNNLLEYLEGFNEIREIVQRPDLLRKIVKDKYRNKAPF